MSAARAWAAKAIELGRRLGAADVVIRATTDLGGAEMLDRDPAGQPRLEHALSAAKAAGLVAPAGRIYDFLNWTGTLTRNFAITDRHLADGLQYCSDNGLERYRSYLLAFSARVALDTGRWDEAAENAQTVIRVQRYSTTPRIIALVVLALVRARRGDPEVREVLDEAWAIAEPTGELHRMNPVALARAEVAWLDGRHEDIAGATDAVLDIAVRRQRPWRIGEVLSWRRRAGIHDEVGVEPPGPFTAEAAGDYVGAAEQWMEMRCPYEAALALAEADDEELLRRALEELQRLGARPAAAIVARRLQERGVRNLPRGPRPSTRSNQAQLTTRELEVLALLADGLRNAAIAERLFVSPRTVDHHVAAILRKLGAQSRGEAVAEAGRLGLLQDPQPTEPI
jgi:DNA-binding CsgD family transcriptional regulator